MTFPTTLDNFTNPTATQTLVAAGGNGLAAQITDLNDAVEALEAKVGVDSSAVATSLDYLLKNTTSGHFHDGTGSKKVLATNIDVTGLTAERYVRVNAAGTALEIYGSGDFNLPAATSNITVAGSDFTRSRFFSATEMVAATTGGPAQGQVESTNQKVNAGTWDFDSAAVEYTAFIWSLPKNWNLGAVYVTFYWIAGTAGGVRWSIDAISQADLLANDTAYGTAAAVSDTADATIRTLISADATLTIGGTVAAGDLVYFRVARQVAHADDTMAADARLAGVKIKYVVGQFSEG